MISFCCCCLFFLKEKIIDFIEYLWEEIGKKSRKSTLCDNQPVVTLIVLLLQEIKKSFVLNPPQQSCCQISFTFRIKLTTAMRKEFCFGEQVFGNIFKQKFKSNKKTNKKIIGNINYHSVLSFLIRKKLQILLTLRKQ